MGDPQTGGLYSLASVPTIDVLDIITGFFHSVNTVVHVSGKHCNFITIAAFRQRLEPLSNFPCLNGTLCMNADVCRSLIPART